MISLTGLMKWLSLATKGPPLPAGTEPLVLLVQSPVYEEHAVSLEQAYVIG